MSEKYKFRDPDGIYFVTPTIVGWIDLFSKYEYSEIILDSLRYCQKEKGLIIHAWCIMPSHLHLIISCSHDNISETIRSFKIFTSKMLLKQLKEGNDSRREWMLKVFEEAANVVKRNTNYKVWQDGNHPVQLDTNNMIDERLNYTHENPVTARMVFEAEQYPYSSAIDYADGKGLLEVELL